LQDLLQNAAMDEIAPGIRHWKAVHPNLGIEVSAYWLPDLHVLLDPIEVPGEVTDIDLVLLSCRHHLRDSIEAAERFGATVRAPRAGMHEFDDDIPIEAYDFGESLIDDQITVHEVNVISPDEAAFHIPSVNALAVADGVMRYDEDLHFVPDKYMDDPEDTKAGLKRQFARLAEELDFDVLLLAHGNPIPSGGREALRSWTTS
jgi:glyoxylase-like metal-dependent hydrolase (beta-lactamase superfamily II)